MCFPSVAAPLAPAIGAVKFAQWWPGRVTEIHGEEFWDYRKPETRILELKLIPSCPTEKQQKIVKGKTFRDITLTLEERSNRQNLCIHAVS